MAQKTEWKPPSYAIPVHETGWKAPSYAKPVKVSPPGEPGGPSTLEGPFRRFVGSAFETMGLPNPNKASLSDYNPVPGLEYMFSHPIDSAKMLLGSTWQAQKEPMEKAEKLYGQPGIMPKIQAGGEALGSMVPLVGPVAARAGEQLGRGDVAGAMGTMAPLAIMSPEVREVPGEVSDLAGRALEPRRIRLGTAEITRAAKPSPANIDFGEDLQIALPDVAKVARENPFETKGGFKVREFVGKLRDRANEIWKTEHEPAINRHAQAPVDLAEARERAAATLPGEGSPQADPAGVQKAKAWIHSELSKPVTLKDADILRRDLNRVTSGKFGELSSPEFEAKKAALTGVRQAINDTLQNTGEPGLGEANRRWGALNNVADTLERRINVAERQPGGLENLKNALHGYLFESMAKGSPIPSIGLGLRMKGLVGAIRGEGVGDVLSRGVSRLGKTSLEPPAPFAVMGRIPVGMLTEGPLITPEPPDTSFVRGTPTMTPVYEPSRMLPAGNPPIMLERSPLGPLVRDVPAEPELYPLTRAMRTGRLLPAGEGEGPVITPYRGEPAGSEVTGHPPYTTEPQPKIRMRRPRMVDFTKAR